MAAKSHTFCKSNACLSNLSASAVEETVFMSFFHLCAYYTQGISCQSQQKCKALSGNTCSRKWRKAKNKAKSGFRDLFCQWSVTSYEFNRSLTEPYSGKGNSGESPGF